jgi:raffinose/stachyose/melibiose transport system permease protein
MMTGLAFPKSFYVDNFINAVKTTNLGRAFINTVIATVVMVFITILVSSMAAYIISRKNTWFYNGVYFMFLAAIILPFQVIMLPMYRVLYGIGLMNSLPGYILAKSALELGFNVFLITSFVKTVPRELDDAAWVDGAGKMTTFWRIIFPLLKPIIMTVIVLNALSLWNDLLAAQIILQSNRLRTLTLEQYSFISQFSTDLGKAFAAFIISIVPIIALYFGLQKYIISGIVAGAVKG